MNSDLCFGFSVQNWTSLSPRLRQGDEDAWGIAVGVFERRMTERYFSCIEALERADTKPDVAKADAAQGGGAPDSKSTEERHECIPGFAIVALCCLLIESIQEFREEPAQVQIPQERCTFPEGRCVHPGSGTTDRFKAFLRHPAFNGAFNEDLAKEFCRGIRNGIMHQAETRGWVIWRDEPEGKILAPEDDGYSLNRTLFRQAVRDVFDEYIRSLRNPKSSELRERFKERMNRLCGKA